MAEEGKTSVREGLKTGVGLLVAFKEAVQETLEEARDRGDFTTDRAKALVQEAAQRVQHSVDEAREKLDFVSRKEFDELRAEVAELRARLSPAGVISVAPGSGAPAASEKSSPSGAPDRGGASAASDQSPTDGSFLVD